ncbi:DUF2381 family protein [Vitiosangium sp. GDMCC 1.1324]|uniref:DUF2381 family protein n=1 Tax=Vitiosangium sp. (strain GDMCC 1.1324) TaxID=2138576 RepID=UPI000D34E1D0|nr:DUF2381 family protein [Vitiosangium sp. GDMCC 1.1324]PTL83315.1 hypothetical protein DAT35_15115 [Vitiosangium sp. GDMCC 1.1324]
MRPGVWFLLPFLLSLSASAWGGVGGPALQRRTLVVPSRPRQVPPLELHVAVGVATLVRFEVSSQPEALEPERDGGPVVFARMEDGSWVFVPSRDLAVGEQVVVTFAAGAGVEPLRFVLVTRRDVVDLAVRVVLAPSSQEDQGAELVARSLLDAPDARPALAVPREVVEHRAGDSRGQVDSVLWMGRRFFATVAVRSRKRGVPPWRLVQARLRATLADGVLVEWPAHLFSGAVGPRLQRHIVTGLLPEGAARMELALDDANAPGDFQPLSPEAGPVGP